MHYHKSTLASVTTAIPRVDAKLHFAVLEPLPGVMCADVKDDGGRFYVLITSRREMLNESGDTWRPTL